MLGRRPALLLQGACGSSGAFQDRCRAPRSALAIAHATRKKKEEVRRCKTQPTVEEFFEWADAHLDAVFEEMPTSQRPRMRVASLVANVGSCSTFRRDVLRAAPLCRQYRYKSRASRALNAILSPTTSLKGLSSPISSRVADLQAQAGC
jgi:hypothetical protein